MSVITKTTPKVKRENVVSKRTRLATAIRQVLIDITKHELQAGKLLREVRDTFPVEPVGTAAFLAWAEKNVSLKKGAAYRYIQAAKTVARVPAAEQATTAIGPLAYLSRYSDEDIRGILRVAGKNPTMSDLESAAVKVSKKAGEKAAKKATAIADADEASRVAADKKADSTRSALRKPFAGMMEECRAIVEQDPDKAITLAVLFGAKWSKTRPTTFDVLPSVVSGFRKDEADALAAREG